MNYVFFGTPRFAEIVLRNLLDAGLPPRALVANPDRPAGRKKMVTPPATKELVRKSKYASDIAVFQPEQWDGELLRSLAAQEPDLFVVAAYAKIIPKAVLDIPKFGTIGVHPSLLPKYRGSSPIQTAILHGEAQTGTTLYHVDEKMDHGPIIQSAAISMDPLAATYSLLEEKLATLGAKLLIDAMPRLETRIKEARPQDESSATYTKKFTTQDSFIEENALTAAENGDQKAAEAILRKVHAFSLEPGAWTIQNGKRLKLLEARIANGALKLSKTQKEGERPKTT